jgi:phosphoribosylanthranilate isomerase
VIGDADIQRIARSAPPGIATFLLTSATDADRIVAQQRLAGVNTIQLVDAVPTAEYRRMRTGMPGIALVQVIHVRGPESLEEAREVAPHVNALLLDSGNPALAVKELGGTGRVHDWEVSRRIVEEVPVPVFLAGGLRPHNVAEAVRRVRPFGLDVCTGVRTDGALDPDKLAGLVTAARAA